MPNPFLIRPGVGCGNHSIVIYSLITRYSSLSIIGASFLPSLEMKFILYLAVSPLHLHFTSVRLSLLHPAPSSLRIICILLFALTVATAAFLELSVCLHVKSSQQVIKVLIFAVTLDVVTSVKRFVFCHSS